MQSWFQSKQDACIAEASSSPSVSKELSVLPDASLSNNAPESSSDMPKGACILMPAQGNSLCRKRSLIYLLIFHFTHGLLKPLFFMSYIVDGNGK